MAKSREYTVCGNIEFEGTEYVQLTIRACDEKEAIDAFKSEDFAGEVYVNSHNLSIRDVRVLSFDPKSEEDQTPRCEDTKDMFG